MKAIELAPAARAELDAAIDQYELARAGRGRRFAAAVERAVRLIARFPMAAPAYRRVHSKYGVRRRVVRGFPFVLAYRVLDDRIRIDAVAHMRRQPNYWHRRVR
ncbi:MAG TPA: type II toxin-antitoxin system RelE/ParE family toxin [Kofleriaceae bacterium]|nr:type II toxin-antitoxin system RelE/ParE family toxin [Kofleriaceae bacterium]